MNELPRGWAYARIADLGTWCGGGTPSKSRSEFWINGAIPWVSPKDMKVDLIADAEDHITEAAVTASATNIVAAGSVLAVTRSGILRRTFPVAVTTSPVAINQDLKALKPIGGIEPKYVAWYLRSDERSILRDCSKDGTTVDSIDFPTLLKREMPIAPSAEQERIIAAIEEQFSRLDAGIAALSRVRQNLKRMRIAVLRTALNGGLSPLWSDESSDHAFLEGSSPTAQCGVTRSSDLSRGWEPTTLGSICECLDSIRIPVNKKERLHRGGSVPYYGANGQVGWIDDHLFDEPLVLVVEDETFTGREKPFSYKITGKSWVNNHAHVLRPRPGVDVDYLNYALAFYPFTPLTTGTTGRKKLTQRALLGAPFALPPEREQKVIATEIDHRISAIGRLEEQVASSLIRASATRRSILNQAFSGKLAPQDQGDEPASALFERIVLASASSNGYKPARARRPRGSREEATT